MEKPDACLRRMMVILGLALVVVISFLLVFSPAQASKSYQETEQYCLSCHANQDLAMTLPSGEIISLYVSRDKLDQSVHSSQGIECEACHTDIKTYPHAKLEAKTKRELSRTFYLACKKCHPDNYTRTQDSMHAQAAEAGNLKAPVCTDCHGFHYVVKPDQPRQQVSTTCSQCHEQIYYDYKESVHGNALIQKDNPDVPVCTDCHGVHNILDPRTTQFHIATPELCAGCHANQELMNKYGLDADVYNLYKLSWHGVDVSVYKTRWPTIWHDSAVCTDCHGIHNIRQTSDPASQVNQANLLKTCQQCHPDAGPNWTQAWTGHTSISPARNPYLYSTEVFYKIFMPAVLWASIIYVALQFLHAIIDKVRSTVK